MKLPNGLSRRKLYRRSARRHFVVILFALSIAWFIPCFVFADCPPGSQSVSGVCEFNSKPLVIDTIQNVGSNGFTTNDCGWYLVPSNDYVSALSSFTFATYGSYIGTSNNQILGGLALTCFNNNYNNGNYVLWNTLTPWSSRFIITPELFQSFVDTLVVLTTVTVPTAVVQSNIVSISSSVVAELTPGYFGHMTGGDISFWLGITMGLVIIVGYRTGGLRG